MDQEFEQRIQTARSDTGALPNMVADLTDKDTVDQAKEDILAKLRLIRIGEVPGEIRNEATRAAAAKVEEVKRTFVSLLESAMGPAPTGKDNPFVKKTVELQAAIDDLEQKATEAANMREGGRRRRKSRKTRKTRKGKKATRRR